MKKFLSLILALLMTVSCASVAFANEDAALDGADTAVEETPYDDAMQYLYAVGIFKGYTEDGQMLGAADPIQRYQMALLAARIATGWLDDDTWLNGNANDTEFTDLQGDVEEKYLGALSYAAQMGLIEGYGDGTFKPYDGITYRDVLTIACRLIGYKNLKYPWGFIEKAVNLGLTEGIEDVAYTEPLTRGGVAQVLYNALFTEVNNTTLAAELFGIELSWADIMVVANDRYVLAGHKADVCGSGKVAIQTIVDGGKAFGEDVWYVDAAQYDLEIGQFYRALFSQKIDGTKNSTLVKAEPYGVVGSADNNGLGDMSNVKAYMSGAVILSHTADTPTFTIPGAGNEKYAYDYMTGHIYNITNDGKTDGIAFYYSKTLDLYFEKVTTDDAEVIYRPVDELDLIDYLKDRFHNKTATGGIGKLSEAPADTAYSHVDVVNAPHDKKVAYYEDYQLGIYKGTSSEDCDEHSSNVECVADCGQDKSATVYKFQTVALGGFSSSTYGYCGGCEKCIGYELVGEEAEANDYVIYGVNDVTKEIKIVKVIDGSEEDSYVARGIVRGYRMTKGYITIGDENLYYNYNDLKGNAISIDLDKADQTAAYAKVFATLVNNYVEYLVVDGKLVWIDISDDAEDYIIVENIAGFDNEGYFVIGGYSTETFCYDTYRIAAIDQWKNGDAYWWNTVEAADFQKGDVYEVTSYNDSNDTYFIKKGALAGSDVVIDTTGDATVAGTPASWVVDDNKVTINNKQYGMSASDKYIFINSDQTANDKPITLYKGLIPTGWKVSGKLVAGSAGSGLMVIANAKIESGFPINAFDYSMAVVLNKNILDMVYDGADEDWYIMGAMQYKLEVFDLYEGTYRTVYSGYNLDLTDNMIYPVIDGMIIRDNEIAWDELDDYYASAQYKTAVKYWIKQGTYSVVKDFAALDAAISAEYGYVNARKYLQNVDAKNIAKYYVDLSADGKTVEKIEVLGDQLDYTKYTDYDATLIYDKEDGKIVMYVYETGKYAVPEHVHEYKTATEVVSFNEVTEKVVDDGRVTDLVAIVDWVGTKIKTTTTCACGDAKEATYSSWQTIEVKSVTFAIRGAEDFEHAIIARSGYFFGLDNHAGRNYSAEFYANGKWTDINSGIYAGTYPCDVEGCVMVNALKFDNVNIKLDQTSKTEIPQSDYANFRFDDLEGKTLTLADLYNHDNDRFWAIVEDILGTASGVSTFGLWDDFKDEISYEDELEEIAAQIEALAGAVESLEGKIESLKNQDLGLTILEILADSEYGYVWESVANMYAHLTFKLSPANGLVVTECGGYYWADGFELAH